MYNINMTLIININTNNYTDPLIADLNQVSSQIDDALLANFPDKTVVLRGVQSAKHSLSPEELADKIVQTGTDRADKSSQHLVDSADRPVDFYGKECLINQKNRPFVLSILEGFHKYKPMSLERPQYPVDVWMIYDARQLDNVEYIHKKYGVKTRDGYLFKHPDDKPATLLGAIVIRSS
jgi:hypothetical protein